jgi:hypothetical protein
MKQVRGGRGTPYHAEKHCQTMVTVLRGHGHPTVLNKIRTHSAGLPSVSMGSHTLLRGCRLSP